MPIIPANPGFDALFITEAPFFRAAPVVAWIIDEKDADPLAVSTEGSDYNALRYPDGRVYAVEHFFPNTSEWLKWLKI